VTPNLITPERAKYNIAVPASYSFTTAENNTIAALIAAYSEGIQEYCSRTFVVDQYDEIYSGNLEESLFLRQSPLISVERVATSPMDILEIKNTSWPTNSRATVRVLSTGLELVRVASGTTTPDTSVTWTTYATLATVAAAVNLLGSGWSATVLNTDYNTWDSSDLRAIQGALDVSDSNGANLKIWTETINDWEVEDRVGCLTRTSQWPRGKNNIRVTYTAGFDPIPEDVQEACAIMVAGAFAQTKRDPMSPTSKTADYTYNATEMFRYPWPANVTRLLSGRRLRMR
jgi:hypothetical protein